jgi:peptide/nickel transport system substrate-binding protein
VAPEQLRNNDNQKPIGSGPFVFRDWQRDSQLTVARNPNYWRKDLKGRQLPYLDQVTFKPMPDEASRNAALAAGNIDAMHTNSSRGVVRVIKGNLPEATKALIDNSEGDEMNVVLNTQTGPASDERLRKALQYATDRQSLVAQYDDAYEIADGPFSKTNQWWSDAGQPAFDLEKAKQLIAEYQKDHPGPVKLTLSTTATPDGLETAQLLQSQWKAAGIDVQIESQEVTKFSSTLLGGTFQALVFAFWNGEDPDINYHFWTGANVGGEGAISLNFPRYTSPDQDKGLDAGRAETDFDKRKADYAMVWKDWAAHAPYIFLYHNKWAVLYRDNVHGIDEVNMPDGKGKAQAMTWGSVNLSNAWTEVR